MPQSIIKTKQSTIDRSKNDEIVRDSMKLIMDVPLDTTGEHIVHEQPDSYRDMVVVNNSNIKFNARGQNHRPLGSKRKFGNS